MKFVLTYHLLILWVSELFKMQCSTSWKALSAYFAGLYLMIIASVLTWATMLEALVYLILCLRILGICLGSGVGWCCLALSWALVGALQGATRVCHLVTFGSFSCSCSCYHVALRDSRELALAVVRGIECRLQYPLQQVAAIRSRPVAAFYRHFLRIYWQCYATLTVLRHLACILQCHLL